MTYSKEWNDIYDRGEQMVRWPWSDLVSLVKRHCGDIKGRDVLELGCGQLSEPSGLPCNGLFFIGEQSHYTGIDGSLSQEFREGYGNDSVMFYTDDFTKKLPEGPFDLICDRAAVTHNDTESIKRCLGLAYDALKPGGLYIGVDWFSKMHDDSLLGDCVDDFTRRDIPEGQFEGCGIVHFADLYHMEDLFKAFTIVAMPHKQVESMPVAVSRSLLMCEIFASFNIVARKV